MSNGGFRGRGFARRGPRSGGPASGFVGPRFPHPNFNHARPPPKRLPAPDKWGERPVGFPPWQGNINFQQRPQFRGNIPFRPNGRGRMPNGRGMVRFSGPGRPPGPQFPVGLVRPLMRPRAPFLTDGNTQEKQPLLPLPGSQEEREQKICETADKLKRKLSCMTQEEIMHCWNNDFNSDTQVCASDQEEQQKGSKGIAELRHGPPELDLTFTDLKDIGRVDSSKVEGEECPEEINLIDDSDDVANRYKSTNNEISMSYTDDNDIVEIPSTEIESDTPIITFDSSKDNKSHKEADSELSRSSCILEKIHLHSENKQSNVVPCYAEDSNENLCDKNLNAGEINERDASATFGNTKGADAPRPVHEQDITETNILQGKHEDSLVQNVTSSSPIIPHKVALHKEKCTSDVPSENTWSNSLSSPLSNNDNTSQLSTTSPNISATTYACQPSSGANYKDVQMSSGSGYHSKTHNELPSFTSRGPNQKYRWPQKGSNCFPIGSQRKSEHNNQIPPTRPRMVPRQVNTARMTFETSPLASPFITNPHTNHNNLQQSAISVSSTDLPVNFDPAKPPPNMIPPLRPSNVNQDVHAVSGIFNTGASLSHIPAVVNTISDNLPGFKHSDSTTQIYNQDTSLQPQKMYSPHGFLPEQSNLITLTPAEAVAPNTMAINLMDMTSVTKIGLEPTTAGFVQLPALVAPPHQPFMPNIQMNFSPIIPHGNTGQIPHNLPIPVPPPIEVTQIQAPPPLPEAPLDSRDSIDDQREATINDGLEDMQEAMEFAKQIMNMTEQTEVNFIAEIPSPSVQAPVSKASPSNGSSLQDSGIKTVEVLSREKIALEEPKKDYVCDVYPTPETTIEPQNVEKPRLDRNSSAQDVSLIEELMRPKVIFNLNSKLRRISKVEDWQHQNEEARTKKTKVPSQTSECKKINQQPSLQLSSIENATEGDQKKKNLNKTSKSKDKQHERRSSQHTEPEENRRLKIVEDTIIRKPLEKSRVSILNTKTNNNIASQKPEKLKRNQKVYTAAAESTWKNRVISRFLKMSKNDIRNMVNNSSLRKFDIAMKHLVKEKRSSLSLELRNTEDEKIKGYDQEEFMNQLNAMLDPGATVDITNLPTEFIHHLSEVLQLDPMPFDTDVLVQPTMEAKESHSAHTTVENLIPEELSFISTDVQIDSKNTKTALDKHETQITSTESKPFISDMPRKKIQQLPLFVEENRNEQLIQPEIENASSPIENTHKAQRLLFNAADLDDILSVVTAKTKDSTKKSKESTTDHLKDNASLQNQQSIIDKQYEFAQVDDMYDMTLKKILDKSIDMSTSRPRKSTSEDRSTFRVERCERWNRKEREDLDTFRNLTKEEWEAKYGQQTTNGSRRCSSNNRTDTFRINRKYHVPERQCLSETPTSNQSLSPLVPETAANNVDQIPDRHNGFAVLPRAGRSRSSSTSSSSSTSESEREGMNPDVTKLLKVIKEKEKIAKKKSINETIRDEVTAEIEKKRKEKSKYKEKKTSSKHSKRKSERRAKYKKRAKAKKKRRESKHYSTETEGELSDQQLLREDEIKKEVVVKEEVMTSPDKNVCPETIAINRATSVGDTHNIAEPISTQRLEKNSQLQSTPSESVGIRNNDRPKCMNISPCVTPTLQPKTKAQLKQMPESTNFNTENQALNTELKSCTSIPIRNEAILNTQGNKDIEKHVEQTEVAIENGGKDKNDASKDINSTDEDNILDKTLVQSVNAKDGEALSLQSSSSTFELSKANDVPAPNSSSPTPETSKLGQTGEKSDEVPYLPSNSMMQMPTDSTLHVDPPNASKNAATKLKKIDIKAYKERALQRRLREEGKLERSSARHSLIQETTNRETYDSSVTQETINKDTYDTFVTQEATNKESYDTSVTPETTNREAYDASVTEKTTNRETYDTSVQVQNVNPVTMKNIVEVDETSTYKDLDVPVSTMILNADLCTQDRQGTAVEIAGTNISVVDNSLGGNTESQNTLLDSTDSSLVPNTTGTESPTLPVHEIDKLDKQVESKSHDQPKENLTVGFTSEFKKRKKKKRKRERGKKSSSTKQQEDSNILSIGETEKSSEALNEKITIQDRQNFYDILRLEQTEVKENSPNHNNSDVNNLETTPTDVTNISTLILQSESKIEDTSCVLYPIRINGERVNNSEVSNENVEKDNRSIDDVVHTNDIVDISEKLHCNVPDKTELTTAYIEKEEDLLVSPNQQRSIDTVLSEAQICEINDHLEIQAKEGFIDESLLLQTSTTAEENIFQCNVCENITGHTVNEFNKDDSRVANNEANLDLEIARQTLISHTDIKESACEDITANNEISPESSNSPFPGFDQACNKEHIYNEKITELQNDNADSQASSPLCSGAIANITDNLLFEEPVTLPSVTSEITIQTSVIAEGPNENIPFDEETMDASCLNASLNVVLNAEELTNDSNVNILSDLPYLESEQDLILTNDVPIDPSNQDSETYIVLSEYINTEDDNIEDNLSPAAPKNQGYIETDRNSLDGDKVANACTNFSQAYIASSKDHDYSSKHCAENDTRSIDEQDCESILVTQRASCDGTSINLTHTSDKFEKDESIGIRLENVHETVNYSEKPPENRDFLSDNTNQLNSVGYVPTALQLESSKQESCKIHDVIQERKQESVQELNLDSSYCSVEVPKKLNVPTKAALKASSEDVFLTSITTSTEEAKDAESPIVRLVTNPIHDPHENTLCIEVIEPASKDNRKEINQDADSTSALLTNTGNPGKSFEFPDSVSTNEDPSPATDKTLQKVEGSIQTSEHMHKTVEKNTEKSTHESRHSSKKQNKGEQSDELHKTKNKPDFKRKHNKKQNISEKTVSEALKSDIVQVGSPNTRESVMARMIEIDLQIHKLMTEKMRLYQMLENNAVPSEIGLQPITPTLANNQQCAASPSILASQLVQKIDANPVLHQQIDKAGELTAQKDVNLTQSIKRKSSTRKEHSHRKRIALSYSSDEDDVSSQLVPPKLSVSRKSTSRKDDGQGGSESLSRPGSSTPERIPEKKRHSDKHSRSEAKLSKHKTSSDNKEDNTDRKSGRSHKQLLDDTRHKIVSPPTEKKTSKKGYKEKPFATKPLASNTEIDTNKRKSEIEVEDNNQNSICVKTDVNKRSTDQHITKHTKRDSSTEKHPEANKIQAIRVNDENLVSLIQNKKLSEEISANLSRKNTEKQSLNDVLLEDKPTSSTPTISEPRTSEGLSIYSDDSTWESFPQNASAELCEQKKPSTGLALLEMSYKKEMARSRRLKAQARKKKKKQLENVENDQTVSTVITSDDEELSLSQLYKKKQQQKKCVVDSLESNQEDENNTDNPVNSQNLDEVINAVAEDRVEDLYVKGSILQDKSTPEEVKLHSENPQHSQHALETQNESVIGPPKLAGETEKFSAVEKNTPSESIEDITEVNIEESVAPELPLQVEQDIVLPTLQKSVDSDDHGNYETVHHADNENDGSVEKQPDTEMPLLYPLNETIVNKDKSIANSESTTVVNLEAESSVIANEGLLINACNSPNTTPVPSFTDYPEESKSDKTVESEENESASNMKFDSKMSKENKLEKINRKKKTEPNVIEESFKLQRLQKDSDQLTDTLMTDLDGNANQELPRRKYLKRKRRSGKLTLRKRTRLTDENVKRIRLDQDTSLESHLDVDTDDKTPVAAASKSLEESSSSKQSLSVPSTTRRRNSSSQRLQNSKKRSTSTATEIVSTSKQSSISKMQLEPQLRTSVLKNCEVRLVDSKYTLLKPNIDPSILRKYGISRINLYSDHSQSTVGNQLIDLQSSLNDHVSNTVVKQNISVADSNVSQNQQLIKTSNEIQVIRTVVDPEDSSQINKSQNIASDIELVHERRRTSEGETIVTLTRTCPTMNVLKDSEAPDIEIVEEVNPAKLHSQDSPELTLSVIEPSDDTDPPRTQYTVHKGPILDVKVYGNSFLAASEDGAIYRYSQASNGILNIYKGHRAAVTCLYIYTMGLSDHTKAWMFSGSLDGTLCCYNIMTGTQVRDVIEIGSPIQCMDEAWGIIFIGTKSGHVSRYHIKSGTIKAESIQFSDKSVLALKATNEGSRRVLIVASRNQPITIRDAQTGLFLRTISGQKSHTVYSLMRHNNLIYCGTSSTSIPVFDFTDGEEIVQYNAGVGIVCMRLYANLLFAGCYDGNIYIFNTKDHKLICSTPGPGNMLLSMEIVDNKIIAGSKDRRLQSWLMPKQVRSLLLQAT